MVTGYDEACTVYADTDNFSSCNAVTGPFPGFPVPLDGGRCERTDRPAPRRAPLQRSDHHHGSAGPPRPPPSGPAPAHPQAPEGERGVRLADRRSPDRRVHGPRASASSSASTANPFTLFVIADLLGVPEEEHEEFRAALTRRPGDGGVGSTKDELSHSPLEWLYDRFSRYVEDRRLEPRHDVLTALATTTFPNGELPEVIDVVRVAANLFAAGQETTVRLLGTALLLIGERPDLQTPVAPTTRPHPQLRGGDPPDRGPGQGRLPSGPPHRPTWPGWTSRPGSTVMVLNGAANRDPRHFEDPDGVPGRPGQRPRAPGLRARRPQLPRAAPWPEWRPG